MLRDGVAVLLQELIGAAPPAEPDPAVPGAPSDRAALAAAADPAALADPADPAAGEVEAVLAGAAAASGLPLPVRVEPVRVEPVRVEPVLVLLAQRVAPAVLLRGALARRALAVRRQGEGLGEGRGAGSGAGQRRERRALPAQWGGTCATDGCGRPGVVPHHAGPWWLTRRTRLRDLVPYCDGCQHDLHEGGKTLKLRNGRWIGPTGWTSPPADTLDTA